MRTLKGCRGLLARCRGAFLGAPQYQGYAKTAYPWLISSHRSAVPKRLSFSDTPVLLIYRAGIYVCYPLLRLRRREARDAVAAERSDPELFSNLYSHGAGAKDVTIRLANNLLHL